MMNHHWMMNLYFCQPKDSYQCQKNHYQKHWRVVINHLNFPVHMLLHDQVLHHVSINPLSVVQRI